ncbi:MAG: hypothetical protein GEU28_14030 [Dehalococcoidia bacterium]|nr:hypothetical protein [Dehalococcoidia bacterium]
MSVTTYYERLNDISSSGSWDDWFAFFLDGVVEQAGDAIARSRRVRGLHDDYRRRLQERRASANALRLVDTLFINPYTDAPAASRVLGITPEGARGLLERLGDVGILEYHSGSWPRLYLARELLAAIEDPLA